MDHKLDKNGDIIWDDKTYGGIVETDIQLLFVDLDRDKVVNPFLNLHMD